MEPSPPEAPVTSARITTRNKSLSLRVSKSTPVWLFAAAVIIGVFAVPIYQWINFSLTNELYSYTLLIPAVSAYLLYTERRHLRGPVSSVGKNFARGLLITGIVTTTWFFLAPSLGTNLSPRDSIVVAMIAFVQVISGAGLIYIDHCRMGTSTFPFAFLLFMVPFPTSFEHAVEGFLQRGSVPPAHWLLQLAGTPVYRDDLMFQLPNITLQVAPECSGIRSTIVLFITSILAGHLFLRSNWRRATLAGFVLPLALLRNGLRIFTIGQLCVSVGPHMIDSFIHHRGGPIFFALSLIPFLLLMYLFIRFERSPNRTLKSAN